MRLLTATVAAALILAVALVMLWPLPVHAAECRGQSGLASWYGPGFHGHRTASGAIFNQNAMTAAHRTLPFGAMVRVTYRGNSVMVRISDRGPFVRGRILDLSRAAAKQLGLISAGVARVCWVRL